MNAARQHLWVWVKGHSDHDLVDEEKPRGFSIDGKSEVGGCQLVGCWLVLSWGGEEGGGF